MESLADDGRPLPRTWPTEVLSEALDHLIADDTDALSPLDLLEDLDAIAELESKLLAAKAKRLASYETRRSFRPAFRTASTAVAHRRGISGRAAGASVDTARALRDLPLVFEALAKGHITPDHVSRLVSLHRQPHLRAAVEEDQGWLVEQAVAHAWSTFEHRTSNWAELADPRDPATLDPGADKRRMAWANGVGGTAIVELITTSLLLEQMVMLLQPTFDRLAEQEWADARDAAASMGRDPDLVTVSDLPRTDAMRWHDALAITLRRGAGSTSDPGSAVTVAVTVDEATLQRAAELERHAAAGALDGPAGAETHEPAAADRCADAIDYRCETAGGVPIPPSLALWCAVVDGLRRVTVNTVDRSASLSHKGRLFNDGQRLAMMVRDRQCRGPGCERRGQRLQGDHIEPASRGGPTHTANGQMLCPACHRHKTWLQAMGLLDAVDHLWNPNAPLHADARARTDR